MEDLLSANSKFAAQHDRTYLLLITRETCTFSPITQEITTLGSFFPIRIFKSGLFDPCQDLNRSINKRLNFIRQQKNSYNQNQNPDQNEGENGEYEERENQSEDAKMVEVPDDGLEPPTLAVIQQWIALYSQGMKSLKPNKPVDSFFEMPCKTSAIMSKKIEDIGKTLFLSLYWQAELINFKLLSSKIVVY